VLSAALLAGTASGAESGKPDPCEQLLKVPGEAEGLHRRCQAEGSGGAAKGDFNGDGFADLAVGVPGEDESGFSAVGAVNVIYGSSTGLTGTGSRFLTPTTFGYAPASDDHFGSALASGDFNGDGYSDLAIGMPDRDAGGEVNAGLVLVVNGSANGINTGTAKTLPLLGSGRAGAALVWADFNGDTYGDLAVGTPDADLIGASIFGPDTGAVQVFYGGGNGLTQVEAEVLFQSGIGENEMDDHFGSVLAAGNFRLNSALCGSRRRGAGRRSLAVHG
jgi:hypothetical protein